MPAKGSQSNTDFNFIPTPSIPYSSSGFHGSQHGSSPAAAPPSFHGSQHSGSPAAALPSFHSRQHSGSPAATPSSFYGSQHDDSSFVAPSYSTPSSSSTPSISKLDFGGSRPVTSSATSTPSSRRMQNLGGDIQYDSYN
nr:putative protein TPRXL [Nicotiana tomentosiformis]